MVEEAYRACVDDEADIAVFKIRYVDARTGDSVEADWSLRTDLIPDTLPFNRLDMPQTLFLAFTPSIWNKMFRKSFLLENGIRLRTDLKYTDDLAFTYTALALADRITIVDKVLLSYRTRRDGSLWTRASEYPGDVCVSLLEVKHQLMSAGVFEDVEPGLPQRSTSSMRLGALKPQDQGGVRRALLDTEDEHASQSLGIDRLSEDTCLRPHEYERYRRIMDSSPEQYLFDEVVLARRRDHGETRTALPHERREGPFPRGGTGAECRARAPDQLSCRRPTPGSARSASPAGIDWDVFLTSPGRALKRLSRRSGKGGNWKRLGSYSTVTVTSKVSAGVAVGSNERQYFSLSVPSPGRDAPERPDLGAACADSV